MNTSLSSNTADDSELCTVSWCDEPPNHDGTHRHRLGEIAGIDADTGEQRTIRVDVTGSTSSDRHVELTTRNGREQRTILTWQKVTWIAAAMHDAARRYAGNE